jgi:serine protease Do
MSIAGLGEIAERLRRSTVLVRPHGNKGNGSGVIWSAGGQIITNAHVARGSHTEVCLWDGREVPAEVVARDTRCDLAALQIAASNLHPVELADSSKLRTGELAIAVGNPLGFVGAMTTGVVHGVGPIRGLGRHSWVQSDVRLAPGNSGGPLADVRGRMIGINSMVAGRMSLAIASNEVLRFLREPRQQNKRPLGVTLIEVRLPKPSGHSFGLVVAAVEPKSAAARASLLPGDILLGSETGSFRSVEDLAIALEQPGRQLLRLEFLRGDYAHVRRVTVQLVGKVAA